MTPLKPYPLTKSAPHVINNTIKRSTLVRLVEQGSTDIPDSVRIGHWSFEWTGKGWTRDKPKDTDIMLLETE